MRAVAFDAMGVLYSCWDDLANLLIPFARANGANVPDAEIGALYRSASRGEFSSAELWRRLGIAGDAAELDEAYLRGYEVTPGMPELLDELRAHGMLLGCISNDLAEWSLALRRRHDLERRIAHWTISGEVGARKPDARIYQAFRASTGFAAHEVLFVDDRIRNVDAAAALGFPTLLVDFAGVGHDRPGARTVNELRTRIAGLLSA